MLFDLISSAFQSLFIIVPSIGLGIILYRRWKEKTGTKLIAVGKYENIITKLFGAFLLLQFVCNLPQLIGNRELDLPSISGIVFFWSYRPLNLSLG